MIQVSAVWSTSVPHFEAQLNTRLAELQKEGLLITDIKLTSNTNHLLALIEYEAPTEEKVK